MPGPVRHAAHGDLGLVPRIGDAGHDFLFHDLVLVHHQGATRAFLRRVLERGQHLDPHVLLHRQFHAARLQHAGADRGELQHLLVGDLIQLAGPGNDSRVGRVDAVDVGVDVAAVGLQRRRQRHRRGVGPAAAQRGDPVVRADALEAGHDRHLPGRHARQQRRAVDPVDPRLAVRAVRVQRDLPAGPGARIDPDLLQRDRGQPAGDLLAGRDHGVVFPRVVQRRQGLAPADQLVGDARHRRHHDRHLVPGIHLPLDPARHVADAVEVGHRGAAELHHDTRHDAAPGRRRGRSGPVSAAGCGLVEARSHTGHGRQRQPRTVQGSVPRAARPRRRRSPGSTRSPPSGGTRPAPCGRCTR